MEQLYQAFLAFREKQPTPKTPEMFKLIDGIVEAYDAVETVQFSNDDAVRCRQIGMLNVASKLKKKLSSKKPGDFERNPYLYSFSFLY